MAKCNEVFTGGMGRGECSFCLHLCTNTCLERRDLLKFTLMFHLTISQKGES